MIEAKALIALERINDVFAKNDRVITGHSGGKDSVVIDHLVYRSGWVLQGIVHNVKPMLGTSGDPVAALTEQHPETLEFLYTKVCKERTITFLHSSNMPSWLSENGISCQIDGARCSEWNRPGKSSNIIVNGQNMSRKDMGVYHENGIFGLNMSYPIYDWTDTDIFDYITENNLEISAEYVKNGELDAYYASKK